jgi:serine/threonine protein phosphatase PrpC
MKLNLSSSGLPHKHGCESHDAYAVQSWGETVVAVLADGAGSADSAREAAQRAVRTLVSNYRTRPHTWAPRKALLEFARHINHTLHQDSLSRFGEPELITTLAVAVVESDRLYGLNVGDSRVYLARDGQLAQLSRDHVSERSGLTHVLDRAIGMEPHVEPHWFEAELKDGDVAVLCSDGVFNVLNDEALAAQLRRANPAQAIVHMAHEHADAETCDDVSAVVVGIEQTGKLRAVQELPLTIPTKLKKGDHVDGFTLTKPFQHSDRVWLASRGDQLYTLKFAPAEAIENEELLHRFIKEIWNATRLQASGMFPRAFLPENATARYYVMEFIEAPNLKAFLRSRRLAVDEAVSLGRFLLKATQHLLQFDLVHGDLKPENILVLLAYDTLQFKLVDFGSMTEVFSITSRAGTASYLAPERFLEAPISERTEMFAIGVTLFEALTQKLPFGEIERFQNPHFSRTKRPSALNPNVPPWLDTVVLHALATEPERRYQSYSEMAFELENPEKVTPFYAPGAPLVERDPLRFYRTGFFILLALSVALLLLLLWSSHTIPRL